MRRAESSPAPQKKHKDPARGRTAAGAGRTPTPAGSSSSDARAGTKRKCAPDSQAAGERVAQVDALDDIFGGLTPKKQQRDAERLAREAADAAAAAEEAAAARKRAKKAKRERVLDPVFGEAYDLDSAIDPQNASVHRFDSASGLRVYKAHALGLGTGGGTPLCPFDCKCCF